MSSILKEMLDDLLEESFIEIKEEDWKTLLKMRKERRVWENSLKVFHDLYGPFIPVEGTEYILRILSEYEYNDEGGYEWYIRDVYALMRTDLGESLSLPYNFQTSWWKERLADLCLKNDRWLIESFPTYEALNNALIYDTEGRYTSFLASLVSGIYERLQEVEDSSVERNLSDPPPHPPRLFRYKNDPFPQGDNDD